MLALNAAYMLYRSSVSVIDIERSSWLGTAAKSALSGLVCWKWYAVAGGDVVKVRDNGDEVYGL